MIAIGSPFGLEQTVTTGIVSALNRQIDSPNGFAIDDAIQTDAAINHGNSGGPLLDLEGRVIGVNSQIESESGGNDGIGFAVPSNTVARIAAALIADGEVEHAYLGIATGDTSSGDGASIAEVRPGTPAAAAGLREGDVVTEIDGEAVADADELRTLIDARQPGDSIELTIVRDGDEQTIEVELACAAVGLNEPTTNRREHVMRKRTRRMLIAGAVAALAIVGGGAALAAQSSGDPSAESKAVLNDAAKQLGVDTAKLTAALKQALANRVDAAVKAGQLTEAQGKELKARIQADSFPILGLRGGGPGHHGRGFHHLEAAATYLGVTEAALRTSLEGGKTLAQVAKDGASRSTA